jgi:hypothetical protein
MVWTIYRNIFILFEDSTRNKKKRICNECLREQNRGTQVFEKNTIKLMIEEAVKRVGLGRIGSI